MNVRKGLVVHENSDRQRPPEYLSGHHRSYNFLSCRIRSRHPWLGSAVYRAVGMKHYYLQVALSIDQLLNAILGGYADETLSARIWRNHCGNRWWKYAMWAVDAIFFLQPGHCQQSYLSEVARKHLPPVYRGQYNER